MVFSKKYEYIEHTADLGLKAYGRDLKELFEHAALAMFESMLKLENVKERVERFIGVEADMLDNLLVAWLSELLYLHDTEQLVFSGFHVKSIVGGRLEAIVRGEILDTERHEIKSGIKAVTYHQLYVKKKDGAWEAQVIFDL